VLEIARAAERDSHECLVDCRDKQYCQDDMPLLTYGQWLDFLSAVEAAIVQSGTKPASNKHESPEGLATAAGAGVGVDDLCSSAPWAEMLAQAETMFRTALETSPVLADLRARLDALQNVTARWMAAERESEAGW